MAVVFWFYDTSNSRFQSIFETHMMDPIYDIFSDPTGLSNCPYGWVVIVVTETANVEAVASHVTGIFKLRCGWSVFLLRAATSYVHNQQPWE
jgi:hypothetical protein